MADNKVEWYEALVLVVGYAGYILQMYYNERMMKWMEAKGYGPPPKEDGDVSLLPQPVAS